MDTYEEFSENSLSIITLSSDNAIKNLPNLELGNCINITDNAIKNLPNLQFLELNDWVKKLAPSPNLYNI